MAGNTQETRMELTLKLTRDEVQAILQVLGQLPTSSNAWPLVVKVKEQADAQLKEQEP